MGIPDVRAIELFAQMELIALRLGGQTMHNNLNSVSVGIALIVGAAYHIAVIIVIASVLA